MIATLASRHEDDTPERRSGAPSPDCFLSGARAHLALSRALNLTAGDDCFFSIDDAGLRLWEDRIVFGVTYARRTVCPRRETFLVQRVEGDRIHVRALDYADLIHTESVDEL